MHVSYFDFLPEDFYFLFASFLTHDDYRMLMNTSMKLFAKIKRKTIYLRLCYESSLRFIENLDFRYSILGKVSNPSKQISLNVIDTKKFYTSLFDLPVHCLNCPPHLAFNLSKTSLHFNGEELWNFHFTGHLSVFSAPSLKKISLLTEEELLDPGDSFKNVDFLKITFRSLTPSNIDCFAHIRELVLENYCGELPFWGFGKWERLSLSNCPSLINVNNLSTVRYLILRDCPNIKDFSPLRGVYDLTLSGSTLLYFRNLSVLGDHHRLAVQFEFPIHFDGYEILSTIKHVVLENCDIRSLDNLSQAESVSLTHCHEVEDISPLSTVKREVALISCRKIRNLNPLKGIPKLALVKLPEVQLYDQLGNHDSLTINYAGASLASWENLQNIKHLVIRDMTLDARFNYDLFERFSCISSLQSLTIESCFSLQHVYGLEKVPKVTLQDCKNLESIYGLGKNREVRLINCPKIEKVGYLRQVPIVTIIDCDQITDIEMLDHVPRLKVQFSKDIY